MSGGVQTKPGYNLLQRELRRRWFYTLVNHSLMIVTLVLALLFSAPAYADADPSQVFAPSQSALDDMTEVEVWAEIDSYSLDESNCDGGECLYWLIYDCYDATSTGASNTATRSTCLALTDDNTAGYFRFFSPNTGTRQYYNSTHAGGSGETDPGGTFHMVFEPQIRGLSVAQGHIAHLYKWDGDSFEDATSSMTLVAMTSTDPRVESTAAYSPDDNVYSNARVRITDTFGGRCALNNTSPYHWRQSYDSWLCSPEYIEANTSGYIEPGLHLDLITADPVVNERTTFQTSWNFPGTPLQSLYLFPNGRLEESCAASEQSWWSSIFGAAFGLGGAQFVDFSSCPVPVIIFESGYGYTGQQNIDHIYTQPGTFDAVLLGSTDCTLQQINDDYDSCDVHREELEVTVSIQPTFGQDYAVVFDIYRDGARGIPVTSVEVDEEVRYEWGFDENICIDRGASLVSIAFRRGYSSQQDAGFWVSAPGDTPVPYGSGAISWPTESDGALVKPKLVAQCSDGYFIDIFFPSTLLLSQSAGLAVYGVGEQPWYSGLLGGALGGAGGGMLDNLINGDSGFDGLGGYSGDYDSDTGSGAYFFVDKATVSTNEPVIAIFQHGVSFDVGSVIFNPSYRTLPDSLAATLSPSYSSGKVQHVYEFSYLEPGQHYPKIQVRSTSFNDSDPSTYRDIYLGGRPTPTSAQYITVRNDVYGGFLYGVSFGIFGLDPSTFYVRSGSTNPVVVFFESALNVVLRAIFELASFSYSLLAKAPVFSFFIDTFTPEPGKQFTTPTYIGDLPVHELIAGQTFAVQYADDETFWYMLPLLQFCVALAFIRSTLDRFF